MKARFLTPSQIAIASDALKRGEIVGIPTETVYGLAAHARNPTAISQVFLTKERPSFDPLIVHTWIPKDQLPSEALLEQELIDGKRLTLKQKQTLDTLAQEFWPGPLTLVLPKHESIPDLVTSGLPWVGVRVPAHPITQELLHLSKIPLAAPSANRFGRISPVSAQDVACELGDRIDWILDGGPCVVGVESSVVRVTEEGAAELLRPGGISLEQLERCLGSSVTVFASTSRAGKNSPNTSPGQLESHYSPRKPLILLPRELGKLSPSEWMELNQQIQGRRFGILFQQSISPHQANTIRVLSPEANLSDSARNLFRYLRELDESEIELILAEPCSTTEGLARAIQDRLTRAAARTDSDSNS